MFTITPTSLDSMYFDFDPGEHHQEDLECDDKWGIWYTYDSGSVPPPAPPLHQISTPDLDRIPPPIEAGTIPTSTELVGNYPNPFNPETWIAYKLAEGSEVTIQIYDARGQVVRTLQLGQKPAAVIRINLTRRSTNTAHLPSHKKRASTVSSERPSLSISTH